MIEHHTDVAIVGGGLAGLSLARELRSVAPDVEITVLERARFPYPDTVHKVGESTVEIGAHYFSARLGLGDHLAEQHLPKHGLRLFFGAGDGDLAGADELGTSRLLAVPTYQIDRGIFENHLRDELVTSDVSVRDQSQVTSVNVGKNEHQIGYRDASGERRQLTSRWLIDAAARTSPVKRHLQLARDNNHDINAVWFRIDTRIRVEDWSTDKAWGTRCPGAERWLSTNHLMGAGYWVWIIPLRCGATSLGIVADPRLHPLDTINTFPRAVQWLQVHQPRLAAVLEPIEPLDFRILRNYSHDCAQVFDPSGWSLSGEAGYFLDPYYSPGSDFIAISNAFIVDLIGRSRRGERIGARAQVYDRIYRSFAASTLMLYEDLYGGFGDRELMAVKTVWDYSYYWGVLSLLYFSSAMTDAPTMTRAGADLLALQELNRQMQERFRHRATRRRVLPAAGRFIDQCGIPVLARLNSELGEVRPESDIVARLAANRLLLERVAERLEDVLLNAPLAECELLGDLGRRLYA